MIFTLSLLMSQHLERVSKDFCRFCQLLCNLFLFVLLHDMTIRSMCGKNGELIVSVLDSGSNGLVLSPGQGHCVVFLGNILYSLLFTQVYQWVPANLMLG